MPAVAIHGPTIFDVTNSISVAFHPSGDGILTEGLFNACNVTKMLHIEMAEEEEADTAGSVWYAGLAMSRYIAGLDTACIENASICELGAGCCVPGLVSAALGAKSVHVTDLDCNLNHMSRIIERNLANLACPVETAVISFGVQSKFHNKSFDVILGADIGFDLSLHSDIKKTLLSLSTKATRIILCEEIRWKDIFDWYVEELETSFAVCVFDAPSLPTFAEKKNVKMLLLTMK